MPCKVAIKVIRGLNPSESNKEAVFKVTVSYFMCHLNLLTCAQRLNREALLWHTLKHPNVLEFFGVVHNIGSFPGLVSPYCEKGPVANYLDDNPQTDRLDLVPTLPQFTYPILIFCLDPWCSERYRVSP